MNKKMLDNLLDYIDKKIDYEFALIEKDEEGYTGSCVTERKEVEISKKKLYDFFSV